MSSYISNYFPIWKGTQLASHYEVQDFLGEGSFGKVARCLDVATNTKVAIKITKDEPHLTMQALKEIKILRQLQTLDADACSLVKWDGAFLHRQFICLKFELLDLSLFHFMEQRCFQPLSMEELHPVLHQLTTALLHLQSLELIHADLKPENVMVVDRRQKSLQVKIIDFGLAHHTSDATPGSCTQTLWYRAPEVILGLDYSEQIDMWSLGLIAAEVALGFSLFPGSNEYDMMKFIVDTLGQPPDHLLNCGLYSTYYFKVESSYNQQIWKLKTPEEFAWQTGHRHRDTRPFYIRSPDVLEDMMCFSNKAVHKQHLDFVDLVKKMLLVDKNERIVPLKVLKHPFFTVEHHSSHNMKAVDVEEIEVAQQPSSPQSVHCSVLCDAEPETMTPQEETVLTDVESVSALLVESDQPETKITKRGFFKRMRKNIVSWFHLKMP